MNYLWILAFCLCGALATPITDDETLPDEMASELDIVEERDDELMDKIEDEEEELDFALTMDDELATPITEDETQPEEMATEVDIVEERDDELGDKIEDEGEEDLEERVIKIAKERKTLKIECPKNRKIIVTRALYGTKKCKKASRKSFKIASKHCNGKKKCTIKASNKVFGDPCVGTRKSLRVSYVCAKVSIACEHKTLKLKCPKKKKIVVVRANYGRWRKAICKRAKKYMKDTKCAAKLSRKRVSRSCNGKRWCAIKASNKVFGDPCKGTFKYLRVAHICVPKK